MRSSFEPGANRTSERDVHPAKQKMPRNATDDGMHIDLNNQ
jgi:hypothetical protein